MKVCAGYLNEGCFKKQKSKGKRNVFSCFSWRGREDLNLRDAFYTSYSLSRGAPSASWVLPQVDGVFSIGGESGIRTHGCFHIAGFQDRCFQPLSHLSVRAKAYSTQTQDIFYHIASRLSMDFCAPGQKSVFHVDNPPCA